MIVNLYVHLSICPLHTCIVTKRKNIRGPTADILIPHERAITLVVWYQQNRMIQVWTSDFVLSTASRRTVLVDGVKSIDSQHLELYFENRARSGGGLVEQCVIHGTYALVTFADPQGIYLLLMYFIYCLSEKLHKNQPEIQADTGKHRHTEVYTDSYTGWLRRLAVERRSLPG